MDRCIGISSGVRTCLFDCLFRSVVASPDYVSIPCVERPKLSVGEDASLAVFILDSECSNIDW